LCGDSFDLVILHVSNLNTLKFSLGRFKSWKLHDMEEINNHGVEKNADTDWSLQQEYLVMALFVFMGLLGTAIEHLVPILTFFEHTK